MSAAKIASVESRCLFERRQSFGATMRRLCDVLVPSSRLAETAMQLRIFGLSDRRNLVEVDCIRQGSDRLAEHPSVAPNLGNLARRRCQSVVDAAAKGRARSSAVEPTTADSTVALLLPRSLVRGCVPAVSAIGLCERVIAAAAPVSIRPIDDKGVKTRTVSTAPSLISALTMPRTPSPIVRCIRQHPEALRPNPSRMRTVGPVEPTAPRHVD